MGEVRNSMSLAGLQQALQNVIDTGKLGTPVSIRVHLQLPEAGDAKGVLAAILEMLSPCLSERPVEQHARRHARHEQTTFLLQTPTGKTVFVTIGFGSAQRPSLRLLVIGNHGIAELQETDSLPFDPSL